MNKDYIVPLCLLVFLLLLVVSQSEAADYTNSIGMKFNDVPAGSFYMGSCQITKTQRKADKKVNKKRAFMGLPAIQSKPVCPSGADVDSNGADNEIPQHRVKITQLFQMGVHEVTVDQYKKFIANAGRDDLLTDDFIKFNSINNNAAVSYVSWHDAQDFIVWLNKKEGGDYYRLPTEAEWEYAARADTTTKYSWGAKHKKAKRYAWYHKNANNAGDKYAHVVGRKKSNPWGLHDMHGNVWEWCEDWYNADYYSNSTVNDPKGPSTGKTRVLRGGSWQDIHIDLRPARRFFASPEKRFDYYGFGFRLLRKP